MVTAGGCLPERRLWIWGSVAQTQELEKKCDEALKQIEERKYEEPLCQEGYRDILKYGVTFYKKDCMVKN